MSTARVMFQKYVYPDTDSDERFAVHPYSPAMQWRLDHPEDDIPVIAVRSTLKPEWMCLYYAVDGEQFEIPNRFADPLPGTGRGGVCLLYTDEPLWVSYDSVIRPVSFYTGPGSDKDKTVRAIVEHYVTLRPSAIPQLTPAAPNS